MREKCAARFDELARLAAAKGVNRRQVLKAAGATVIASAFAGCSAGGDLPRGRPARHIQVADSPEREVCNHELMGQACYFVGCGALMAGCAATCATPNRPACLGCLGGLDRCMRSCGKQLDCHCVTGVACHDSFGAPFGPAFCCHPPAEECLFGLCVPACNACEHRTWLGSCESDCTAGQQCCHGTCIDTLSDDNNCGTCGNRCTGGQTCEHGICDCSSEQLLCDGTCVNILTDPNNCGQCSHVCTSGSDATEGFALPLVSAIPRMPGAPAFDCCGPQEGSSCSAPNGTCTCCLPTDLCCNSAETDTTGPYCCPAGSTCCTGTQANGNVLNKCCPAGSTCIPGVGCSSPGHIPRCCAGTCC